MCSLQEAIADGVFARADFPDVSFERVVTPTEDDDDDGLSDGAIAGIVIGVIVAVILIALLVVFVIFYG